VDAHIKDFLASEEAYYMDNHRYTAAAADIHYYDPDLPIDAQSGGTPAAERAGRISYFVDSSGVLTIGSAYSTGYCIFAKDSPATGVVMRRAEPVTCLSVAKIAQTSF